MDDRRISRDQIEGFARMLRREELRESTIENYLRHVAALGAWMGDAPVTKERVAAWKESLLEGGRCPGTVNSMLVSANRFFVTDRVFRHPSHRPAFPEIITPGM